MSVLLALTVGAGLLLAEPADDWKYRREGEGERRTALDAGELKPFDLSLLNALTSWQNGSAPDARLVDGKVLAIVFWNNAEPTSVRAVVPTLKRLEMTYGDRGFVSVAVHGPDHWDEAQERIASGLMTTRIALDADGALGKALGADEAPDCFVIDRAGQMRFADLDDRDLPNVVRALVGETREEAQQAGARRAERASLLEKEAQQKADREKRRAEQIAKVPPRPGQQAYMSAAWPEQNKPRDPARLNAKDVQGKPLPVPFGKETWLSEPVPLEGRVVVLDFWATWCGPCIAASPKLDSLQKKYVDDLVVIGVAGQARGSQYPEDERTIRQYMKQHKVSYSHVHDVSQGVYRSLGIAAIPHVVVLSSDGVVRWQGNPHDAAFEKAVEETIAVDPWVTARHE
ncbi:MAG: TlpA family protein disulfide reductase [Phycisphaerales bacterium]|nr:TlpA family protein disulfide reductase [Phycisphaerales bacterium]